MDLPDRPNVPAGSGLTGFSTWSLTKLRAHLLEEGIVAAISRETLRRIVRVGGVPQQTTPTWNTSPDPDPMPTMRRILDPYDHPPADGRVLCVDELGPLNLFPRTGKAWRPFRRPRRVGVPADLRVLAELDRGRVRCAASPSTAPTSRSPPAACRCRSARLPGGPGTTRDCRSSSTTSRCAAWGLAASSRHLSTRPTRGSPGLR